MVRLFRLLAALGLVMLAACAAQPVAQPTLAPDPTRVAATAPTTIASPAPQPTAVPVTAEPLSAATSAPIAQDAIPIGRTPEGYHYLGSPNAPVTIVFYSDFF